MKVVLDTNVLVSGLLSPFGLPAEILRMAAAGAIELCYDARILAEYRTVLLRPEFSFERSRVEALLEQIEGRGHLTASVPLPKALPDPEDEAFLEAALAGGADYLVTGNLRHFPADLRHGVRVLPPREFLGRYRQTRTR